MCLQFCTNIWGSVSCFRSGYRICSYPTKNNNASKIQSAVWSCSSQVKRIFCVGIWQRMKHGTTTTHRIQKDRQLSGQQLVEAVRSDWKLNSGLATLWHPHFETRMGFCLSTLMRKVKLVTATIKWHYWIDWAQKSSKNVLTCKKKVLFHQDNAPCHKSMKAMVQLNELRGTTSLKFWKFRFLTFFSSTAGAFGRRGRCIV